MARKDIFLVSVDEIEVEDGFNVRIDYGDISALANSISENGILVPLRAYKKKGGKFIITDGHRRYKAAMELYAKGIEVLVPIVSSGVNRTEESRIIDMLICNDGKPLNLLEESEAIRRLTAYGYNDRAIAVKIGKTGAYISNLRLLGDAPQVVKNYILEDAIAPSQAIRILRSADTFDDAINLIKESVTIAKSEGKKKATGKHVEKASKTSNSFGALKKVFKDTEGKRVREGVQDLYVFLVRILNGEITKEEIEEVLFVKPKSNQLEISEKGEPTE
jgi:ParB/RepB/Spo0J family partition protein